MPRDSYRATLLIPTGSDFSLRQVAAAMRAWDWRLIEDAPPGDTQPDRIEQDGEDGEVCVNFGDWCIRFDWTEGGRAAARAVIVTDPEPEQEQLPRDHFPTDWAYIDYLDSLPCYEVLFQSCLIGVLARFPEAVAFSHYDETGDVGASGRWWGHEDEDATTSPPAHLVGWLDRIQITQGETYYEAAVRCLCGCDCLEVHYPGATHQPVGRDSPIPCTVQLDGLNGYDAYWFGVKAVCAVCSQECILFDSKLHGWDAVVASSAAARARAAALPRPRLLPWACVDCGAKTHECEIHLRLQGPGRFLSDTFEDTGWPMPLGRRADAFGWFGMSIRCCGCGRQTDNWIGYETR